MRPAMDMVPSVRALPASRAAWQLGPDGFAVATPLSGSRTVLAVGRVGVAAARRRTTLRRVHPSPFAGSGPAVDTARARMHDVVLDHAMTDGHDPGPLFERINAALTARGLGRLDGLALLSQAAFGLAPEVAAAGRPVPLVRTSDGMSVPITACIALDPGWSVVLGTAAEDVWAPGGLLPPADVDTALTLLSRPSAPGVPPAQRTLLAVRVDG